MTVAQRHWSLDIALVLAIGIGALILRTGLLHAPAEFDELYHLLAARSWLVEDGPNILDGSYTRGQIYTWAVTQLFAWTGDQSLAVGRLISVAASSVLPVLLYLWIANAPKWPGQRTVGVIAAGFVTLWPQAVIEAQLLRFYALHVLCVFVAVASAELAMRPQLQTPRIIWIICCGLATLLALKLQITSAIALGAVALWGGLALLWHHSSSLRQRLIGLTALSVLGGVTLSVLYFSGVLEAAWTFYRWTPGHSEELRNYWGFYHAYLRQTFDLLWFASPVLGLLALWVQPRLGSFCLFLFALAFLAHSFGGMKAYRYLSYAVPFLMVIWAMGLMAIVRAASQYIQHRLPGTRRILPLSSHHLGGALCLVALVFVTPFGSRSVMLAQGQGLPQRGDWRAARGVVGDWIEAPMVLTTRELHMVTHVGPYDVLISASRLSELPTPAQFGIDPRTGRPVISSPDALSALFACHRSGVLVTSPHWWSKQVQTTDMQTLLERSGLQFETRSAGAVLAMRWYDPVGQLPRCVDVPV